MMLPLRIAVLGYLVRMPLGGMSWHYLHYFSAAHRLGHEVVFLEDSSDEPWCCYDPRTGANGPDPSYGLAYAARVFDRLEAGDRWGYFDAHRAEWHGPLADRAKETARGADLVLNISAANPVRPWLEDVPVRVLIDTDPLFSQVRNLSDPQRAELVAKHNRFFSFGVNIESRSSLVPQDAFAWLGTTQPVALDLWPPAPPRPEAPITTVMQWDSYSSVEYEGNAYHTKAASFGPFFELPKRTNTTLEIAIGSSSAPREQLAREGWELNDPLAVTEDPWTYQRYIQQSKAEFSVAKHGYVASRSGWFSERSANYLATGRPVVVQDTGFSDWMETGTGVLPFSTPDEAVAAIEDLNTRYDEHCRAARDIAEEYFDSRVVLGDLIERAMAG